MPKTAGKRKTAKQSNNQPRVTKPKSTSKAGKPKLQPVESTSLEAIGYLDDTSDLYVTFRETGDTYRYGLVPRQVYEELLAAESKGKFFDKWVRQKPYPAEKVA